MTNIILFIKHTISNTNKFVTTALGVHPWKFATVKHSSIVFNHFDCIQGPGTDVPTAKVLMKITKLGSLFELLSYT